MPTKQTTQAIPKTLKAATTPNTSTSPTTPPTPKITIDPEFKSLLPPLDAETYRLLEESIIEHGCRDALVLWGNTLIDGHNRYEICTRHKIAYTTVNREFDSRESALIYIITNQVSRRNLTPIQLSHYRGLHYQADKRQVTNAGGKNQHSDISTNNVDKTTGQEVDAQNGPQPLDASTATRLARRYKVSRNTIKRDANVATAIDAIGEASPEAKQMILSGEVAIEKKALEALATASEKQIASIATSIAAGTYERQKATTPAPTPAHSNPDASTGTKPNNPQLITEVSKRTDNFYFELMLLDPNDTAAQSAALRTYIDQLEELYEKTK